jgi:uncharacterized protein (DUF1697 family)
MAESTTKYVALLRGINVGGKNILPMKDLAAIFREGACSDVSTFIQSGNVLFNAGRDAESVLPEKVSKQIAVRFGYQIPVVLRSIGELDRTAGGNPFLTAGVDDKALHVYFLRELPSAEAVAALDAERSLPDRFAVRGREIYLHLPNGMARTKLTNAWFDSKLKTVSTARNWNTVLKLLALMKGTGE